MCTAGAHAGMRRGVARQRPGRGGDRYISRARWWTIDQALILTPPLARQSMRTEVRPGLVPSSVFKTDGAPRERRHGGFDSRALPLLPRPGRLSLTHRASILFAASRSTPKTSRMSALVRFFTLPSCAGFRTRYSSSSSARALWCWPSITSVETQPRDLGAEVNPPSSDGQSGLIDRLRSVEQKPECPVTGRNPDSPPRLVAVYPWPRLRPLGRLLEIRLAGDFQI